MKIEPNETILKGSLIFKDGSVTSDSVSQRIENLIANHLIEIGEDESGWNKLYRDPVDNRYWELTYPESEAHGGGAPQLKLLSDQQAKSKYQFL